jgi:hypothetical protein
MTERRAASSRHRSSGTAIHRVTDDDKSAQFRGVRTGRAVFGGFVKADDTRYQIIRHLNETAKRPAAQK